MLAKRRSLQKQGIELARTPLLVPSFSSKGFPDVKKILRIAEELIEGPTLVSAYDLSYSQIAPPFDFASFIFLDSGGYEAAKDADLSDIGAHENKPETWNEEKYAAELSRWESRVPTIFITYDHPEERLSVREQIDRANRLTPPTGGRFRELLLKPETSDQRFLKVESVTSNIRALSDFEVIGVTEKEIGVSILERMENIARIRKALTSIGLETPIHVFGSLDTITTPFYFVAGADIFDGLTWLRFAFKDGFTMYKQNYAALQLGVSTKAHLVDARCWFNNYYYLKEMELEMRRFLTDHDFGVFRYHSEILRDAHNSMIEEVGG